MAIVQYRWCCGELRWCDKSCEECDLVTEEQKAEQEETRKRDRKLYKTWAVKNGIEVEGED